MKKGPLRVSELCFGKTFDNCRFVNFLGLVINSSTCGQARPLPLHHVQRHMMMTGLYSNKVATIVIEIMLRQIPVALQYFYKRAPFLSHRFSFSSVQMGSGASQDAAASRSVYDFEV